MIETVENAHSSIKDKEEGSDFGAVVDVGTSNVGTTPSNHCDNCLCGVVAGGDGCMNSDGCCGGSLDKPIL